MQKIQPALLEVLCAHLWHDWGWRCAPNYHQTKQAKHSVYRDTHAYRNGTGSFIEDCSLLSRLGHFHDGGEDTSRNHPECIPTHPYF